MRNSGPLGMSLMPVASTTIAPGFPFRKAHVPVDHVLSDIPVITRPPGHHGGHPGALCEIEIGRKAANKADCAAPPRRWAIALRPSDT